MKIGIIGGGQLGRMMALAGYPLNVSFKIWTDSKDLATSEMAEQVIGSFSDPALIDAFCKEVDVVTYEWENVPVALAQKIASKVPAFYPGVNVLEVVQNRSVQKNFLQKLKIPTAPFLRVESLETMKSAAKKLKFPCILKTCTLGYDGKGQIILRSEKDLEPAWKQLGKDELILEGFVKFEHEVSLVCARSTSGEMKFYSLVENQHEGGILRTTIAPLNVSKANSKKLQTQAEKVARSLFKSFDYVGVMTIEFFLVKGKLLVNEVATRVHNSGHWTIEGAHTSQFENHVRAILGMPLGSTALNSPTAMINILGKFPDPKKVLAIEDAHFHHYGKTEAPGRKIGHITVRAKTRADLFKKIKKIK